MVGTQVIWSPFFFIEMIKESFICLLFVYSFGIQNYVFWVKVIFFFSHFVCSQSQVANAQCRLHFELLNESHRSSLFQSIIEHSYQTFQMLEILFF